MLGSRTSLENPPPMTQLEPQVLTPEEQAGFIPQASIPSELKELQDQVCEKTEQPIILKRVRDGLEELILMRPEIPESDTDRARYIVIKGREFSAFHHWEESSLWFENK